jgi:phage transcriptional regulator, ArpU family
MGSTLSLDEKVTVKLVREFLTDDLPKLQLMARIRLSSVSLDAMPTHHSNDNTAVDTMTKQVQARLYLDDMVEALSVLPDIERRVITLKYIDGLQWFTISDRLHLSVRRLQEIMQKALNDFGVAYAGTLSLLHEDA